MSRRGDAWSALAWGSFGTLVLVASWRMDRLSHQGVEPWAAPGLLPGVAGAAIVVFALALGLQAWRAPLDTDTTTADAAPADAAGAPADAGNAFGRGGLQGAALAALLCIAFAGLGLGRGLPFVAEAAAFVLAFVAAFAWPRWRREARTGRGLALAALIALASSAAIATLFESVFLVRLP